ncbi:MAG TPA: helix-turn-helix domain-containing protein, partial [Paracoccus solventivorans]
APTGGAVVLSPREVLLLEQFVPAAGQPVSRRSLDAVMGYGEPGSKSRGLDQALARLHEKARRQNVRLPLQVIHAIGIRFAAPLSFR